MSEFDDLTEKLRQKIAEQESDKHSLLPRVLLALLESGRRNEDEITKLADQLSQAASKAAERHDESAKEIKATQVGIGKLADELSQAESKAAEHRAKLAVELSKAKLKAAERHDESAEEIKATQDGIGKCEEEIAKIVAELSRAESKAAEHRVKLATELSKAELKAAERHDESAEEIKAAQDGIGKLRRIVIGGVIFLALVIPAVIVGIYFLYG